MHANCSKYDLRGGLDFPLRTSLTELIQFLSRGDNHMSRWLLLEKDSSFDVVQNTMQGYRLPGGTL